MNKTAMNTLEYPEIIRRLSEMAISESGRRLCEALTPETDVRIIELRLLETEEARAVSDKGGVPLSSLSGMEKVMEKLGKTTNLTPEELSTIRSMNRNVSRMMRFMQDRESIAPTISTYAASMNPLEALSEEIDRCIIDNRVDDRASTELANAMRAVRPRLDKKRTVIVKGRHPLLPGEAVPLDFHIGEGYRALVITGPNTGGKTVVLKTVGLFHLMAQAGLHVPAMEGTVLAVYDDIVADIGDGQSITQSLSTFSSHIRNIIAILACAGPRTLAIVDELGTGTDPGEGMGLAVAVMEALYDKGTTLLATTHYSEIKEFAATRPGFRNGCMGFNVETLMPRYELSIGIPGESNAFLISLRLGMDPVLVERAHRITYHEAKDFRTASIHAETPPPVPALPKIPENIRPLEAPEIRQSHEQTQQHQEARHKARMALEQEKRRMTSPYKLGDCVFVTTMNRTGIVCETENARGEIGVMIMKKKMVVSHKRVRPFLEGKDLYPEDYNLDTVLESVQNRKARHKMGKRHVDGLQIVTPAEETR